ncbi:helicase-associated domain-containing protein [Paenibacillus pini]|uniref:Helicase XPB/Ssl2 N-terminal domain-containing protein n=1 Tax=Paenibacillus pini JCM 16418 TaxID=1236976 RepID=W7Y8D5_9BACL|nr:helicase-associated domain-containing protein [Paenibacillus pini]GAF07175.1 hypothetical protein JCM16418_1166 [Paenibacillus pini JCM 16418]
MNILLEKHEHLLMKLILERYAGQPFDEEHRADIQSETLSGAQLHLAFLSLRRKGYIEAVKKAWGERIYFIPSPQRFADIQTQFYPYTPVLLDAEMIHVFHESKPGITLDLLHVLAYAAHQGLALTSKGTLHKRIMQKLSELSHLQSEDLEGLQLQYAHPEIYPLHTAVILDLLLCLGLIFQEPQAIMINEERLYAWLTSTVEEMNKVLFQKVIERYSQNNPVMQHFRYFMCQPAVQQDKWFDITSLIEWMRDEGLTSSYSLAEIENYATAWLRILSGFGWGDSGQLNNERLAFKWNVTPSDMLDPNPCKDIPSATEKFYVQPDFDIIVPPNVSYLNRWQLLCFTEVRQSDRMSVYRLTKNSVTEGVEKGLSISALREFLVTESISGVPDHIDITLEQWNREIGRTRIDEVTLLSCDTEEEGHRIAAHPLLVEHIEQIGPRHFIVKHEGIPQIRKALDSLGLTAMKQIGGPAHDIINYPLIGTIPNQSSMSTGCLEHVDCTQTTTQGLVYSGRNMHYFEKDNEIAESQSLFPGISQIPAIWYNSLRSYHTSTAQTIIEQAYAWETKVLLHLQGGSAEFIPRKILSNPWEVEGDLLSGEKGEIRSVRRMTTDDWDEMKLLLPEMV